MPYRLNSAQKPRARPAFAGQKHPLEPVGTVFKAESFYDKAGEGTWLLSVDRSGNSDYPKKWYHADWCDKASNLEPPPPPEPALSNLEDAVLGVMREIKRLWSLA